MLFFTEQHVSLCYDKVVNNSHGLNSNKINMPLAKILLAKLKGHTNFR